MVHATLPVLTSGWSLTPAYSCQQQHLLPLHLLLQLFPQPNSGRRARGLPPNPPRPNYRDCRRNHDKMQSYFALIEDVFNTLLGPTAATWCLGWNRDPHGGALNHISVWDKGTEQCDLWVQTFQGSSSSSEIQDIKMSPSPVRIKQKDRIKRSKTTFDLWLKRNPGCLGYKI